MPRFDLDAFRTNAAAVLVVAYFAMLLVATVAPVGGSVIA